MARLFTVSLIASIVFVAWLRINDRNLPYPSQSLQYECDPACAQTVVKGFPAEQRHIVYRGIAIDYGFLIAYGLFFASACFLTARKEDTFWKLGPRFWRLGRILGAAAILAAVLDAIEGIGLIAEMRGHSWWAPATCWLSRIKIFLLAVILAFLILRLIANRPWTKWPVAKELYLFLLPLRFTGLLLALLAFAFLISDQGFDVIANVVEDDRRGIRNPHTWQRIGFVAGMTLLALQAWYWSRHLLRVPPGQGGANTEAFPRLTEWLPRIAGVVAFLIGIGSLVRVFLGGAQGEWRLGRMIIELVVLLIAFVWFTVNRRKKIGPLDQQSWERFGWLTWAFLGGSTVVSLALFAVSTFNPQWTVVVGSAVIVTLSFALAIPIGSLLVYAGMRGRFPVLTLLFLWAVLISPLNDNHAVRATSPVAARPTVEATFNGWFQRLQSTRPPTGEGGKYPVFIVAAEGGGIRAAYWTAIVLSALSDGVPEFHDHLFAISGVSGGAVGAAVYEGLLIKRMEGGYTLRPDAVNLENIPADERDKLRTAAREVLSQDVLAPTLAAFTQPDLAQRFVPVPIFPDRAKALERGWERAWRTVIADASGKPDDFFAQDFAGRVGKYDRHLPSLFFNGTVVETGQRITTSNCDTTRLGTEVLESIDYFDLTRRDVRVSTAAHNSARFTYVSPAGRMVAPPRPDECCYPAFNTLPEIAKTLRPTPKLKYALGSSAAHIVDGGYFENSGAATALDIVNVVKKNPRAEPYVIFIQYTGTHPASFIEVANEALSPVRALLAVRGGRGELSVADLKRDVKEAISFELRPVKDTTFPLGWLLADHTRSEMDKQMGDKDPVNGPRMARIAQLLRTTLENDVVQEEAAKVAQ